MISFNELRLWIEKNGSRMHYNNYRWKSPDLYYKGYMGCLEDLEKFIKEQERGNVQ